MEGTLISVIIPNYNCEEFLERCIRSVVNQTYKNIEIIIIDDGSNDNSREIIEKLKKEDNRIVAIYKNNGGASSARNAGLDAAKGDYVCFIDSDDYVNEEYLEKLFYLINKYKVTISLVGNRNDMKPLTEKIIYKEEIRKQYFSNNYFTESPVEKLLHRTFFDNLRFKEGYTYEDTFITYKLIEQCSVVAFMNYHGYIRNSRVGSITRSEYTNKFYDKVIACREIYLYYLATESEKLAYRKYIGSLLFYILKTDASLENNKVAIKELESQINKNGYKNLKIKFLPLIILLKLGLLNKIKLK